MLNRFSILILSIVVLFSTGAVLADDPPAVVSTEVMNMARCSWLQRAFMVSTSKATSLPRLPLAPGIS